MVAEKLIDRRESLDASAPIGPQLLKSLRGRIIRTELAPGMRLSEQDVAQSYDLSRQPVREAFIRLAEEGFLEIRPQRGTFVRRIRVSEVMEARFMREAIEADIVRLAANNSGSVLIDELRSLVERQAKTAEGDAVGFMHLDETFHRVLADAAGKHLTWSTLQSIKAQMGPGPLPHRGGVSQGAFDHPAHDDRRRRGEWRRRSGGSGHAWSSAQDPRRSAGDRGGPSAVLRAAAAGLRPGRMTTRMPTMQTSASQAPTTGSTTPRGGPTTC